LEAGGVIKRTNPHPSIALIFARLLSVAWSSYTIWRTHDLRDRIAVLIGDASTPCHLDIFPSYFSQRAEFQVCKAPVLSIADVEGSF
jgi:hypothetical protein